ncbi:MAG: LrgB family protein [Clostridiales bacterium]|nr:LrgB family protein [Clostridiales bacterium]
MAELLQDSIYFGVAISLFAYWIGVKCKEKWNFPLMNPLLISMVLIILFLWITKIPFETYSNGAKYITYFLTPATVCFAVPLYRQLQALKENMGAVLAGILCGSLAHGLIVMGMGIWFVLPEELICSILPKSVTTAIALGVSEEIGGIAAVTVVGVTIAGLSGNILGPVLLKWFKIEEPEAQGLALGTASHAIGTSKAVELGEIQGAMSSLAIVVTGILTVVLAPWMASVLATL